jgi:hypothetical protein
MQLNAPFAIRGENGWGAGKMNKLFSDAWSEILPVLLMVWGWLDSWLGHRIEVGVVAGLVLLLSYWVATTQNSALKNTYHELKFPGPMPTRPQTAHNQLQRIDEHRKNTAWKAARQGFLVGLFGFVVPSVIVGLSLYHYPWFFPNQFPLTREIGCDVRAATHLNLGTTVLFVLAQFFMGFGQHIDEISTRLPSFAAAASLNPANSLVMCGVILYRIFIGAFSLNFLNLVRRAIVISRSVGPREQRLIEIAGH